MKMEKKKINSVLFIGTYPPRKCGIANFTRDLTQAINKQSNLFTTKILAINQCGSNHYYSDDVVFQIDESKIEDYIKVARKINETDSIKLVCLQHEFGLFGGRYGKYLLHFIEELNKPLIVTFHTILPNPEEERKYVIKTISEKAHYIVIMNEFGIEILRRDYELNNKIMVIPHGIHYVPFQSSIEEKIRIGHGDKIILSTFGLLREGKGIEYVIEALPKVIKKFKNVLYLIVGETHPNEKKRKKENYRESLKRKVNELNLDNHVKFYNKYLCLRELLRYLVATDIYIAPCLNANQITSGTISYAMGCGRVVISTPTLYAKQVLMPNRGVLTRLRDPSSFAEAIIKILSNPRLKEEIEKNAYEYTRDMLWSNVASMYINLFKDIIKKQ